MAIIAKCAPGSDLERALMSLRGNVLCIILAGIVGRVLTR